MLNIDDWAYISEFGLGRRFLGPMITQAGNWQSPNNFDSVIIQSYHWILSDCNFMTVYISRLNARGFVYCRCIEIISNMNDFSRKSVYKKRWIFKQLIFKNVHIFNIEIIWRQLYERTQTDSHRQRHRDTHTHTHTHIYIYGHLSIYLS